MRLNRRRISTGAASRGSPRSNRWSPGWWRRRSRRRHHNAVRGASTRRVDASPCLFPWCGPRTIKPRTNHHDNDLVGIKRGKKRYLRFCIEYFRMDIKSFDIWFAEAKNDMEMGDVLLKKRKYSGAVFHFVQSAEKAVKGLLYLLNLQPWGHSLSGLLLECEKNGINVKQEYKTSAKSFDVHYTSTRYPDASPTPPRKAYDKATAETIKRQAKAIITFIEQEKTGKVKP